MAEYNIMLSHPLKYQSMVYLHVSSIAAKAHAPIRDKSNNVNRSRINSNEKLYIMHAVAAYHRIMW